MHDMVERLLGEQEAAKRLVLTADSVPQDEIGLRQLIVSCLLLIVFSGKIRKKTDLLEFSKLCTFLAFF